MQSSESDSVRQASAVKDHYEGIMNDFKKDPAGATGMTNDELARRRTAASSAREVEIGDKNFKIQSTTRAQQIMQQGTNKMALNKRLDEVKKNMGLLHTIRWIAIGTSAVAISMIAYTMLLPIYVAQTERNKRLEMRQARSQLAREQRELEIMERERQNQRK